MPQIKGTSELMALTADIDWWVTTLPAGRVEVSAGFEYRYENLHSQPDAVLRNNLLVAGGNRRGVDG